MSSHANGHRIDTLRLAQLVRERTEDLCRTLFPNGRKEGGEWKLDNVQGEPGRSLGVCLSGARAGLWYDHATGEGKGKDDAGFVRLLGL
jgi:hypothetical protein